MWTIGSTANAPSGEVTVYPRKSPSSRSSTHSQPRARRTCSPHSDAEFGSGAPGLLGPGEVEVMLDHVGFRITSPTPPRSSR